MEVLNEISRASLQPITSICSLTVNARTKRFDVSKHFKFKHAFKYMLR